MPADPDGAPADPLAGPEPPPDVLCGPVSDLAARLRDRLDAGPPPRPVEDGLRAAGVVALLTPRADDRPAPGVVLIERSRHLSSHAGQLALPGGKPEPDDRDLWHTAVREAGEEVGLAGPVEPLGRLAPVPTPTGFWIVPFVALAPAGFWPAARTGEVARVHVPALATLADPRVHRVTGQVPYHGRTYDLHEFDLGLEVPLWGATARVLWDLLRRLA